MNEYRIKWQQCPHREHEPRVSFVEASDVETARAVLTDHVERTHGISWFSVHSVELYLRPQGGRVLP